MLKELMKNCPVHHKAIIKYVPTGETILATETQIRYLQVLIATGQANNEDFLICDKYTENKICRDGRMASALKINTMRLNDDLAIMIFEAMGNKDDVKHNLINYV